MADIVRAPEPGMLQQVVSAEVDVQVATAHRFPRDLQSVQKTIMVYATSSKKVAEDCYYALPRRGEGGKQTLITGPSVHLARIVVSCWGNFRASTRVMGTDDTMVHASGLAWDLQSNVALASEVSRRITGRNGRRYSDDMVAVTGAAASAIAYRNAVFGVIPRFAWEPVFEKCLQLVAGGAARDLEGARDGSLQWFAQRGLPEERVLAALGLGDRSEITPEHVTTLRGLAKAHAAGEVSDLAAALGVPPGDDANGSWRRGKEVEPLLAEVKSNE